MSSGPYERGPARDTYRGPDRRTTAVPRPAPWSSAYLLAGSGLLLGWVVVSLGVADGPRGPVVAMLDAASAAVAATAAVLCALWSRMSGRAPPLFVAVALGTLATTIAVTGAAAGHLAVGEHLLDSVRVAGMLVAVGFVTRAATGPEVDAGLRPLRMAGVAVASFVGLAALLTLTVGVVAGRLPATAVDLGEQVVLAAALIAVAVVAIVRAARTDRFLFAWLGLMLLGFALAEVTAVVGTTTGRSTLGGDLLELGSVLAGLTGIALELHDAYADQRRRLLDFLVRGRASAARVSAQHAATRQRAHDAYSALAAIEGASLTLERAHDRLDPATRESLAAGIGSEITRLQRLVGAPPPPDARVPFDLDATLRPVVAHERSEGTDVVVDAREGLTAFGRAPDTAEVVTRLLRLARDRAPGRPVLLRTDWVAGRVIVRLEDRGGPAGTGTNLDLAVCSQLLADQDGELRVDARGDGGSVYQMVLPAVGGPDEGGRLRSGAQTVDHGDQRSEITQVDRLLTVSGNETSRRAPAGTGGDVDDGVRDQVGRKGSRDERHVEAGDATGAPFDDDDLQAGARQDAGDHVAEQPRLQGDRDTPD